MKRSSESDNWPSAEALFVASYARLVRVVAVAADNLAEAEDVVQEAFVRLLTRWDAISRYEDPEAWVRCVAFRLLSNHRRKMRNRVRAVTQLTWTSLVFTEDRDLVDEVGLSTAISSIPLELRQVVVLYYLIGLPVNEVGKTLGLPVGTVKSRLSRARVALQCLLPEEGQFA